MTDIALRPYTPGAGGVEVRLSPLPIPGASAVTLAGAVQAAPGVLAEYIQAAQTVLLGAATQHTEGRIRDASAVDVVLPALPLRNPHFGLAAAMQGMAPGASAVQPQSLRSAVFGLAAAISTTSAPGAGATSSSSMFGGQVVVAAQPAQSLMQTQFGQSGLLLRPGVVASIVSSRFGAPVVTARQPVVVSVGPSRFGAPLAVGQASIHEAVGFSSTVFGTHGAPTASIRAVSMAPGRRFGQHRVSRGITC